MAIQRHLGLQFEDAKLGFLNEVLQRRLAKRGWSSAQYLEEIAGGSIDGEVGPLAQDLTVTETYFFRNIEQFFALRDAVLPDCMRARGPTRSLRLLSAACASGEEAYTIAIVLKEANLDPAWNLSVRAVDINPSALAKAKRAPVFRVGTAGDARRNEAALVPGRRPGDDPDRCGARDGGFRGAESRRR